MTATQEQPAVTPSPEPAGRGSAEQGELTPERIVEFRRRLQQIDLAMRSYSKMHSRLQAAILLDVFDAVKTIPRLLDEIERLQGQTGRDGEGA